MSFDVFGARRNASTWALEHNRIASFTSSITLRGYTGHEQLDELALVHMGGRIYDPVIGRFLQADPFVQQPNNIQSFNRYSYVMNNPLNKTDPSGYIWATLISYALNYIATTYATTAIGSAIGYALTAYQFYGQFQLAKGVLNAIEGGGTAMANFAGGFAKSYVKGMVEGAVIQGLSMAINSKSKEGGTSNSLANADASRDGAVSGKPNDYSHLEGLTACTDCEWEWHANQEGVEFPEDLESGFTKTRNGDRTKTISTSSEVVWEGEVAASPDEWERNGCKWFASVA